VVFDFDDYAVLVHCVDLRDENKLENGLQNQQIVTKDDPLESLDARYGYAEIDSVRQRTEHADGVEDDFTRDGWQFTPREISLKPPRYEPQLHQAKKRIPECQKNPIVHQCIQAWGHTRCNGNNETIKGAFLFNW
jgi:hypothetical protein